MRKYLASLTALAALAAIVLVHADAQQPAAPAQPQAAAQGAAQPDAQPGGPAAARRGRAPRDPATNHWAQALETDPHDLKRYQEANKQLPPPAEGENRVVFMGDSITDSWARSFPQNFPGKPYIGRGISSETTQQMLVRFHPDVVALKPKVVVILAGTNDIAGNTGRQTQEMIQDNFISLLDIAQYNTIKVVLISILPASDYWWQPGMEPAEKIVALNAWLKDYAAQRGVIYVDCHTPMSAPDHGMKPEYSRDGVHPTPAGYALMASLVEPAIEKALAEE